jgi:hypothetical protein
MRPHTSLTMYCSHRFTLYIDHSMNAPRLGYTRNALDMTGGLVGKDGKDIDVCQFYKDNVCPKPIAVGQANASDIVPLAALLKAADVDLDTFSPSTGGGGKRDNYSKRFAGVVLLVRVFYDNTFTYNTGHFRYRYEVEEVSNTQFKAIQPEYDMGDDTHRTLNNRHGLRLVFQQAGMVGRFNFQTMLVQLVSSLGLLAVATVVVDIMATSVMPKRQVYKAFKFEECDTHTHHELLDRGANSEGDIETAPLLDDVGIGQGMYPEGSIVGK